jgi:hypothetical protein
MRRVGVVDGARGPPVQAVFEGADEPGRGMIDDRFADEPTTQAVQQTRLEKSETISPSNLPAVYVPGSS